MQNQGGEIRLFVHLLRVGGATLSSKPLSGGCFGNRSSCRSGFVRLVALNKLVVDGGGADFGVGRGGVVLRRRFAKRVSGCVAALLLLVFNVHAVDERRAAYSCTVCQDVSVVQDGALHAIKRLKAASRFFPEDCRDQLGAVA